jgi:SAM-dependent methyltransferase
MAVTDQIREWWDEDAATYDNAPGHRPRTAAEKSAWMAAMASLLPEAPARVLDCGAGTGFLSLMAARLGHRVTALDVSGEMLGRLRSAASDAGVSIETVQRPASEPPPGPFDVVIERHLLWTLTDPVGTLDAWRASAPSGRLVLMESLWGAADPLEALRARARDLIDLIQRRPPDHHGVYPEAVRSALPLGRGTHPSRVTEVVEQAGWVLPQLHRLRDVEWATLLASSPLDRLLGVAPRFAITAEGRPPQP